MLGQRLITESGARPASDDDERRRYYELTAFGARVAAAEHARLADLVAAAGARLGSGPLPGLAQ